MKIFVFNWNTRKFEPHRLSPARMVARAVRYLTGGVIAALAMYVILSLMFNTRSEKALAAENDYLAQHCDKMVENCQIVDDVIELLEDRDRRIYENIFQTEPPSVDITRRDTSDNIDRFYTMTEEELSSSAHKTCLELLDAAAQINREIKVINDKFASSDFDVEKFPSSLPLKNFTLTQTGAGTGPKLNPFYKTVRTHTGIDLMAPFGTDVVATANGTVVEVVRSGKGLGNCVVLDHNGIQTVYAHLNEVEVRYGERVRRGEVIGTVGNSGTTFASALHYEVRVMGRGMNPVDYFFAELSPYTFNEMSVRALTGGQSLD